jgi:hypothetical protein
LEWLFPIYGKTKNVPNHQPVVYLIEKIKSGKHINLMCKLMCSIAFPQFWGTTWFSNARAQHRRV